MLANVEKLMKSSEKRNYRILLSENCDDEVLIQKDITRTYPDQPLFEKKSLVQNRHETDPFDYVHIF